MINGSRLIAFDVDSTLLRVESLDYALSQKLGASAREEIEAITSGGMSGTMSLRQSLMARLDLTRLTRSDMASAAIALQHETTPGFAELLTDLRERGDQLVAISGGFADILRLVLRDLGFGPDQIFANQFLWEGDVVAGLDVANPLSDNGGKPAILNRLRADLSPSAIWMVGDGITDLETLTTGAADHFIGFGAIARRDAVVERAPDYANSVEELRHFLLG